jgi:hypothetical protein
MAKGYLPYDLDERPLLPPDLRAWLPEGHLALFILDVVGELDLSRICGAGSTTPRIRAVAPATPGDDGGAVAVRVLHGKAVVATHREGDVRSLYFPGWVALPGLGRFVVGAFHERSTPTNFALRTVARQEKPL